MFKIYTQSIEIGVNVSIVFFCDIVCVFCGQFDSLISIISSILSRYLSVLLCCVKNQFNKSMSITIGGWNSPTTTWYCFVFVITVDCISHNIVGLCFVK
jgi:hypothetical protein